MLLSNLSGNHRLNGRPTGVGVHLAQNYKMPNKLNFLTQGDPLSNIIKNSSFPTGTQVPYTYLMGMGKSTVELSSTTSTNGVGTLAGGLTNGIGMTGNISGTGSLVTSMAILYSLVGSASGLGTLAGSISNALSISGTSAGVGTLSATVSLLQSMIASALGTGSLSGDMKQNISMSGDIFVNQSTATVNELVAGVWSALATDYNVSGTMGNKLNGAGSAGDPWTTDLSAYNIANTAGKILKDNPAALEIINQNIKKASKLIPAVDDI